MTSPIPALDLVRARLAEIVATAPERTAEEQKNLIAGLLATAFETRRGASASV